MEFQVIPKEQTPRVPDIEDFELFMIQNIQKFVAFKEYAETRDDAIGLAANQCAIYCDDCKDGKRFMARVFAIRDLITRKWRLVFDPVITEYIGIKEIKCEGCLTWKGQVVVAERSRGVWVRYYDETGRGQYEFYKGLEGQIWQHEINHLNGVEEKVYDSYVEPKRIEVGRNEKCPCGSNLKYKQCCLLLI
jgi:peptide deformylase